jgi:uncharacterized protein YndB with AHSA1/START domain
MELVVTADLPCPPDRVFAEVDDLDDYPRWMGLVHAAESREAGVWLVELRARVGPFARSKRLRMRRVELVMPTSVRFEREEDDGRRHGEWVLDVVVEPTDSGSRLVMTLSYSGRLWSSVVERVLHEEIEASKVRLRELVA